MLTNKVNSFLGPNFLITFDVMLWALSCTHVLQSERQLNSRIMIKLFRISTMFKDQERVCQKCSYVSCWPMTKAQAGTCTDPLSNNDDY